MIIQKCVYVLFPVFEHTEYIKHKILFGIFCVFSFFYSILCKISRRQIRDWSDGDVVCDLDLPFVIVFTQGRPSRVRRISDIEWLILI